MSSPEIISPIQLQVLKLVVDYLQGEGIPFHITSGLAGNIYGSRWPLHDIDIDVHKKDLDRIAEHFAAFIYEPLEYMEDDAEFKSWAMALEMNDVIVEFNAVEDFFIHTSKGWQPFPLVLERANNILWEGMQVPVQPLEDIIAYKELIGREKDVADLRTLTRRSHL